MFFLCFLLEFCLACLAGCLGVGWPVALGLGQWAKPTLTDTVSAVEMEGKMRKISHHEWYCNSTRS